MEVINFSSEEELKKFVTENFLTFLGEGSEGFVIETKNHDAVKIFGYYNTIEDFEIDKTGRDYKQTEIITTEDIQIKDILFPEKLIIINDQIYGYVTKAIKNIKIGKTIEEDYEYIKRMNYNKFIKAYYEIFQKIITLSNYGIEVFDLAENLIYDGNKFIIIDTLGYKKKINPSKAKTRNLASLNRAIETIFNIYGIIFYLEDDLNIINCNNSIEIYIAKIREAIEASLENQYIKKKGVYY